MTLECVPLPLRPDSQIRYAIRRRVAIPYIMDREYVCLFSCMPWASKAMETNVKMLQS